MQRTGQLIDDLTDQAAALFLQEGEAGLDRIAAFRMQFGERQILKLVLHPMDADALGQGRIDLQRFPGDPAALVVVLDVVKRRHIVQTIGQLHHQHPDILGHREHELAEILRLLGLIGLQFQARQLGDAIHQARNIATEQPLDIVERRDRILDRIVQ